MLINNNHLLDALIAAWAGDQNWPIFMADTVIYESNHQGSATGKQAVRQLFDSNFPAGMRVKVNTTNQVVKSQEGRCTIAAYFYGEVRDPRLQHNNHAYFGGMVVINADKGSVEKIGVHLNWLKGNKNLVQHWHFPHERQWQPGDIVSPLISETDAPWHLYAHGTSPVTDAEAIAETWFQYAWALDMADYGLFEGVFTENVRATLPPMGELQGRRMMMATLKAFRMPWPWIQHYGVPLSIDITGDRQSAVMILGRIIPENDRTEEGALLYGAHYKIELQHIENKWQISRMDYLTGWFTVKDDE